MKDKGNRVRTSIGMAELNLTYRRRGEPLMVNVIVKKPSRRKYQPHVLLAFFTFVRRRDWKVDSSIFQRDGRDVTPPEGLIDELTAAAAKWAEKSPSLKAA